MTTFEPVLAFGAALGAAYFSLGLGALIAISGIASSFFHSWIQSRDNARLRSLRDAQIEQGYFMDLHRGDDR